MEPNKSEEKVLFEATVADPNHEFLIEGNRPNYSEVTSFECNGFTMMNTRKIVTRLDEQGVLGIFLYQNENDITSIIAKDFVFGFQMRKIKIRFIQSWYNGEPTRWYKFHQVEDV